MCWAGIAASTALPTFQQHCELVTSETSGRIRSPYTLPQPSSDRNEQLITDGMPQAVIDRLEIVDVHEGYRERLPGLSAPMRGLFNSILEQRPVGEFREGVVQRLPSQLLLERLLTAGRTGECRARTPNSSLRVSSASFDSRLWSRPPMAAMSLATG